jgi:four helix bundle protein
MADLVPESFERRSFNFAIEVLRTYRAIARTDAPKLLATQMLRAGTSIGANLAEAKSASSRRDLIAKNAIALREARECLYWLQLLRVDQPESRDVLEPLVDECNQLIGVLAAAVRTLRGH